MEKRFLNVEEAGEVLGMSRAQVYRYVASGELKVTKLGRSTRLSPEDIDAFAQTKRSQTVQPVAISQAPQLARIADALSAEASIGRSG